MSSTCSSSSSSTSSSSTENNLGTSESRSSQVGTSTHRSQVGTSTPQVSTLFSRRDALGEIKDEAEDKFDEDTWFSVDEKRNKMTKESIVELLEEIPLPSPFSAPVPALQEPANYGTDLETSVYEGQIRSGYRVPMHPFDVAFFNHYKMAPGQLVPNGWRKLVGLIYLVQTSGYPVTVDDFMRLYLEVCFIKNVANIVGWFPGSQRYHKKLIDHIKRRGVLSINEPLLDQEMQHAGLIPPALAVPVPPTPVVESQLVLGPKTQGLAIGMSSFRTPSLEMAGKGVGAKVIFWDCSKRLPRGKGRRVQGKVLFLWSMENVMPIKSDLETYLEEGVYICEVNYESQFDVIGWWKANNLKYKILSKMAVDILSIPITTVAKEAAFSTGGRVIDPYRASLSTKTVEALICGRDLIRSLYGVKEIYTDKIKEETVNFVVIAWEIPLSRLFLGV
ncbi:hypothetical protein RJ639_025580 [Escallonia herrerae]|uniref:Transposase n=1 Tax=Escallonia herrerae TaxID=1293975 RepID=A0AA89ABK0_9ASTE|nr:hypothetical protein RJ639_025580 [Escallonia herrerae]